MAYQNMFERTDDLDLIAAGDDQLLSSKKKAIKADISFDLSDLIDDIKHHGLAENKEKLVACIRHIKANLRLLDK